MNTRSMEYKKQRTSRCAIYALDSTDEHGKGNFISIQDQILSCRAFIEANAHSGWELVAQEVDIASGKTLARPGLQKLLAKACAGEFDRIVTYKIDRLSRSINDFYDLWCGLGQLGIDLACSTQAIDTSNGSGRLMLEILLSFAYFEGKFMSQS